ncbi:MULTISPECIES: hypothetical protein [Methylobacterium]|mgnify:CR=1 FL=1|jgi:hypothetical protein|uniref:Uncharacterized protein n=2 Tax=Methylobacteriaceae TaxID=119045 RepID=A0AAJ1TVH0_9HYPH|nr:MULTISPECIES: hypothetical protein [Methylobacterium]EIZ86744.1 hypothetical protein WYO_0567 [Methylobacterium sp. GXF4]MCB4804527.1 hypothetical protein [Methylobacterium brachiatum]MDF2597727.1 hypothetical protein [Methylobacterium brachiatum]MDH2312266.1 hypothetical protein [Methylobacterium brachiatum]MDQ0545559.1 hypothetical protein [Methylobacterium brachiatum]
MAGDRSQPRQASGIETSLAPSVTAVMARAQESGLTRGKASRISGRVAPELIERAKARTGLHSDTALIEFALANIAIEDGFADVFRTLRASVDPELDLSF